LIVLGRRPHLLFFLEGQMNHAAQDFPVTQEPTAHVVGRELLALAAASLLFPFGLWRSAKRTARRAEQRTVVLVHGYLANRGPLLPLAAYLRARGHKQILAYEYSGGAGIEQAAIGLRDFLRERVRGGRIDLVCHSLGGLVARVYLQQLGGARRVDRCITLGTPHRARAAPRLAIPGAARCFSPPRRARPLRFHRGRVRQHHHPPSVLLG
jgi:triacylglycerol esterase/lipase EstA (alpha/beta hydrolase family)